ncbi:MAG: hypothetical protein ABI435_02675 [Pseudolysinimonas sp.]
MSESQSPGGSARRFALAVALTGVAVAVATAIVFLARAGGDPAAASTWPITWELRSSDNGTLFQFWGDVAAGRTLDWSFSPQVFVFPELPLSGVAYLTSAGGIYGYYLVVAILNQVVLFLLFTALARVLWPAASIGATLTRAVIAIVPLLLLPVVGTSWVMSFHLAPTYYVGMYFALVAAPLLFAARRPWTRALLGVALALTIASNPLTVVFAAPGLAAVVVARIVRSGWRSVLRPAAWVVALAAVTVLVRIAVTPLQGTGLLAYLAPGVFSSRLAQLWPYWSYQLLDPAARIILPVGALLAFGCLFAAVTAWIALVTKQREFDERRSFAAVFLGLVPVGGIVATFLATITQFYYFWPALVLPFALAAFALPRRTLKVARVVAAASLLVVGIVGGGGATLADAGRYFGYRSPETQCLDAAVSGQVGFATFSDARRVSLPSATGVRLIQVNANLTPNLWLTNRAYSESETGTFFYANEHGDERALDGDVIFARFGAPDRKVSCSAGQTLWIYDRPLTVSNDQ